jgi:hypothetical protein
MTTKEMKNSKTWWMVFAIVLLLVISVVAPVAADNPWSIPAGTYYNYTQIPSQNALGIDANAFNDNLIHLTMTNGTGGQNAVHISNSPANTTPSLWGQCTALNHAGSTGTFYVTNVGGRNYQDNVILLVGMNSTNVTDYRNYQLTINASGYKWTPHYMVVNQGPFQGEPTFATTNITLKAVNFTKNSTTGFITQPWRFGPDPNYPWYCGDNTNTSVVDQPFNWSAIDLNMGIISNTSYWATLNNNGTVAVNYAIKSGLSPNAMVAFNVYVYNANTSQGLNQTLWINRVNQSTDMTPPGNQSSPNGWLVMPGT